MRAPHFCTTLRMTCTSVPHATCGLATKLGAYVEHFSPSQPGLLSSLLADHLSLPADCILALLRFGAVYHSPVHPPAPAGIPPDEIARVHAIREAGLQALGRPPTHQEQAPRRLETDCIVQPWCYVRIHLHPKRFPMAYGVDWQHRVVMRNDAFVVIDKPPGVSSVPRVDNHLESCLRLTAEALGLQQPLLATHRLDTYTQGLLVMATQPEHVAWFNAQLTDGSVARDHGQPPPLTKVYRTLTATPPAVGLWRHACWANVRLQGLPACTIMLPVDRLDAQLGSKTGVIAELHVIDVQEVALTGSAATRWGPSAYESTVQLVTGRTHQIRAQLAVEGHPLLGDPLYAGLQALCTAADAVTPERVVSVLRVAQEGFQRPPGQRQQPPAGTPRALQDADDAMGLQAWQLHVRVEGPLGGPCVLEAATPWWRT